MLPTSTEDETGSTMTLDIASVTEAAAVAAARWRGRGDEASADRAAVAAMHEALQVLPAKGTIVIGEGDPADTDQIYAGETIGAGLLEIDIAADALEGTTVCAKALPNALSVIAIAKRGHLLQVPHTYMSKIAVGPGYEHDVVDLDASPAENLQRLAKAKGTAVSGVTACILDRPRNAALIEEVRQTGAAVRLIGDGDIAGIIHTTAARETGIDIYMGIGGAREGVLAAAALACIGGQMQGRLCGPKEPRRAAKPAEAVDFDQKYTLAEMASGDVSFAATGITAGSFLRGVRFASDAVITHTIVMRSRNRSVRWIRTERHDGKDTATQGNAGRIG